MMCFVGTKNCLRKAPLMLIALLGTAIVMRNVPSMNAFAVYGLLVLIDLFMMYGMIRRQENKALSLLLKGEQ